VDIQNAVNFKKGVIAMKELKYNSFMERLLVGWEWNVITIVGLIVILLLFPHIWGPLLLAIVKVSIGAILGYWISRTLIGGIRVESMEDSKEKENARFRRALIIAATILAVSLGT